MIIRLSLLLVLLVSSVSMADFTQVDCQNEIAATKAEPLRHHLLAAHRALKGTEFLYVLCKVLPAINLSVDASLYSTAQYNRPYPDPQKPFPGTQYPLGWLVFNPKMLEKDPDFSEWETWKEQLNWGVSSREKVLVIGHQRNAPHMHTGFASVSPKEAFFLEVLIHELGHMVARVIQQYSAAFPQQVPLNFDELRMKYFKPVYDYNIAFKKALADRYQVQAWPCFYLCEGNEDSPPLRLPGLEFTRDFYNILVQTGVYLSAYQTWGDYNEYIAEDFSHFMMNRFFKTMHRGVMLMGTGGGYPVSIEPQSDLAKNARAAMLEVYKVFVPFLDKLMPGARYEQEPIEKMRMEAVEE